MEVAELFAQQVVATPERTALTIGDIAVSYARLGTRVAAIRRVLPAAPAAIAGYFDHRVDAVAAFLAVLSHGSCYVPLAPVLGASRVVHALTASGAALLLTDRDLLPGLAGTVPAAVTTVVTADLPDHEGPGDRVTSGPLAYVIYTSGSTGRPKGVAISPRALAASTAARRSLYGPGGTLFLAAPLCFDSALSLFAPLVSGGTVRLSSPEAERDAVRLAGEIGRDCTHVLLLPSVYREVLEVWSDRQPPGLAVAIVAGEAAPPALLRRHFALAPGRRLVNEYGPTEATVFCTAYECAEADAAGATVPIGRAVDGYRVIVTDADGQLVPDGETGELRVAGPGLAQGYLHEPELTEQHFTTGRDGRWYRTGDLGRRRPDGALEFLGRADGQVKVRGVRVELGEVQQLLSEVPGVLEAAAILVDGVLMGFVRATGDLGDVRALLPPGAPAYLVPQAVHRVAELPRTATGKLDRAALAARTRGPAADVRIPDSLPPTSSGPAGVAPDSSPLAALLVAVRTVTGLPAAAERPFTAVGDSLAAMRVCTRLYTRGWTLDPTVLLDGRRLAEAAAHAHRRPADQPARAAEPGPLSPNQSGIWFAENLAPGSTSFLVPLRLRLDGVPDPDRLRAALTEVVRRHPVLDCRIDRRAGRPVLTRMDEAPWLDQVAVGSAEEADDLAAAEAAEPIDLHHEPPLRATLVQLPRDRSELLLTLHHIAFDGWSGDLLLRDLCEAYRGTPDRPRPADFLTYAARQAATAAAGGFAAEASLVAEQLRGLPTRLSLRERDDRTPALRAEGSVLDVDPALRRGLTELAHARHTTLFVTLLSGFAEGLAQVTGQRRLIIGTVTANRPHLDLEEVIGLFTNIVPIGLDLDAGGARHGSDLIGHVRDRLLAAMRHARVPFSAVVSAAAPERTPGHAPLVQVLFEYFGEPRTRYDLDGIAMTVSGDGLQQGAVADFSLRVFPYDAGLRCVAVRDASVVAEHVATAVLSATTDAWRRMVARRIA